MTPALKKELEEAHRLDVIGSGFVLHEITNLEQEFAHLPNKNPNVAIKYWQMSKDANSFRENILRLAAFRYFKDRLATGDQNVYGASKKSEVDQIRSSEEKAAKLARELIGVIMGT